MKAHEVARHNGGEDPETDEEQSSSIFSSLYRVGLFGFIAGSDKIDSSDIRTSA